MNDNDALANRFGSHRSHLRAVAYRMLGSASEADDAVQEAWLRLSRTDADAVENLGGWLTTVVARVCLDMLRARKSRREDALELPLVPASAHPASDPEAEALLGDSVGPAMLVVLETLAPAERVAFVLHDLFDLSFGEIAAIVGRSEAAARQLASRARRRVRGAEPPPADVTRRQEVVRAFLAASREGDFGALVRLLDPEVSLRADPVAVALAAQRQAAGAPVLAAEVRGPRAVSEAFAGRATAAQLALVDGNPAAVWAPGGKPRAAFVFTIRDERIVGIEVVMEPTRLDSLDVELVGD